MSQHCCKTFAEKLVSFKDNIFSTASVALLGLPISVTRFGEILPLLANL